MNLIKRLHNLYRLSEYEIPNKGQDFEIGDIITPIYKPRPAQIIKRKTEEDIIKEILNEK